MIMLIAKPVSHIPMHKIHWKKRPKVGEQERGGGEHMIMKNSSSLLPKSTHHPLYQTSSQAQSCCQRTGSQ